MKCAARDRAEHQDDGEEARRRWPPRSRRAGGRRCPARAFWAAMPEPMTMAARKALPKNSASSRRHSTVSRHGPDPPDAARRSAAGRAERPGADRLTGSSDRLGDAARAVAGDARSRPARRPARCRPPRAPRRGRSPTPCPGRRSSRSSAPRPRSRGPRRLRRPVAAVDLVGGLDLDAEVVQGAGDAVAPGAAVLHQHELERRIGNGEVGVARAGAWPARRRRAWSRTSTASSMSD